MVYVFLECACLIKGKDQFGSLSLLYPGDKAFHMHLVLLQVFPPLKNYHHSREEWSASPTSPWKKAASCQATATAPLNRHSSSSEGTGFTGSTKAEKSYTFYCRFSVSVLESTAALEADIPTSLPHKTLPQTQPQATPKITPGFAVQTSVPVRTKTLMWLVTEEQ